MGVSIRFAIVVSLILAATTACGDVTPISVEEADPASQRSLVGSAGMADFSSANFKIYGGMSLVDGGRSVGTQYQILSTSLFTAKQKLGASQ